MRRLDDLSRLSNEKGRLTRLYLSKSHRKAIDLVEIWMREAGMTVRMDEAATLVGRTEPAVRAGDPPARTLILGSHLDTVRDAGRFDGMLGVVTAIEAMKTLAEASITLPFAVEVAAFGDEEGIRFPRTLTGSRAMAGAVSQEDMAVCDEDGVSLEDALAAFGCDPSRMNEAARAPDELLGYVELHIEQGRKLENAGRALGLVSGISGAMRTAFTLVGQGGHAGTTAMSDRRDAVCAAAEMILSIERRAAADDRLVATVGRLDIVDASVNVIAGRVDFSLDLRCFDDTTRKRAFEAIVADCAGIAAQRRIGLDTSVFYDVPSVVCDRDMTDNLRRSIGESGDVSAPEIPSMAGHDGLAMSNICSVAMVFVRCRDGVSHSPDEHVSIEDIVASVKALTTFLQTWEPRP